ncbi:MAG: dienelactone hydrolase family protein [Rhodospirillales bacterium]|nr:MAG: dienelactone hydrolase family protein [Rhodospirillales bacterium]
MSSEPQGSRLHEVVGHWLPRMMVAGLAHGDIMRLIEETGSWPNWCATFSFDGPGQGEGRRRHHLRADWGPVLAAVTAALRNAGHLDGPVGVMGMAFGGHLALQGAAAVPGIAAVASMNGFFDFGAFWDDLPEVYRANMGFALGGANLAETAGRARAFSLDGVALPDCPILVIHGGRDRIFPVGDARRVAEAAGKRAEWVEYPDGNHVCNNIAY